MESLIIMSAGMITVKFQRTRFKVYDKGFAEA